MRGLRLVLGIGAQRAGTGGGGGTAPTITGTPLLTDDTISVSGTLPMTFYSESDASATPLSAAAIKAAPDDTIVLSGGMNYLPALSLETGGGTWYLNYVVSNSAGDSAVETESYVVATTTPDVLAFSEYDGFGSTFDVTFGATSAGDSILIAVAYSSGATVSAPDFTLKGTSQLDTSFRMALLEWNGGGTRPNSSNVTVTLSSSSTYAACNFVVEQAAVGAFSSATTASSSSHTLSTVATAGSAVTIAVVGNFDTVFTPTGPGGAPTLDPALPAAKGYFEIIRPGNFRFYVLAYDTLSAGTTPAITLTSGFGEARHIIASVEA